MVELARDERLVDHRDRRRSDSIVVGHVPSCNKRDTEHVEHMTATSKTEVARQNLIENSPVDSQINSTAGQRMLAALLVLLRTLGLPTQPALGCGNLTRASGLLPPPEANPSASPAIQTARAMSPAIFCASTLK
jgi:hypothetical protein